MAVETQRSLAPALASRTHDIIAGLSVGILALPICLAAGVLVFSPLGPDFVTEGATAGLCGAIIAGAVTALVATSSFVITGPRAGPSLVLATFIAALTVNPAFTGDPESILGAAALCVFLGGSWQILFGLFRVSTIIKFTPHPVFAGFLNGVALLIIKTQLKPFFIGGADSHLTWPQQPLALAFVGCLTLLAIFYARLAKKLALPAWAERLPGAIVAFGFGIFAYHLAKWFVPAFDLGPVIGKPEFKPISPLMPIWRADTAARIWSVGWNLILTSLVLAIVTSVESLMSLRVAQNIADIEVHPTRDLAGQGCGNCAAALLTVTASAATPSLTLAAYRSGGRTRLTSIVASAEILLIGFVFSDLLAAVPNGVLSAVLLAIAVMMFDAWSVRLVGQLVRKSSTLDRRSAFFDLAVVITVMGVTAMTSIAIGVIAGCLLSGIIFIVNMSRPVVRSRYWGDEIFSKRIRSKEDIALLQATGRRRAVLQLEGVLFFGNADNLSREVKLLSEHVDMIALDMRGITGIDLSGFNILRNLINRGRGRGKRLLFCNVPISLSSMVRNLFDQQDLADAAIKIDLDSALEWMEEEALRGEFARRERPEILALEQIDFLDGVAAEELAQLRQVLKFCEFKAGDIICREGDPGDKMWLLVKGSVSVRLHVNNRRGGRRIASLGRGTVVGEMALIEGARRSASIIADEDIACYQLSDSDFNTLLRERPELATRIMRNAARELVRRLRRTSEDLRHATS